MKFTSNVEQDISFVGFVHLWYTCTVCQLVNPQNFIQVFLHIDMGKAIIFHIYTCNTFQYTNMPTSLGQSDLILSGSPLNSLFWLREKLSWFLSLVHLWSAQNIIDHAPQFLEVINRYNVFIMFTELTLFNKPFPDISVFTYPFVTIF